MSRIIAKVARHELSLADIFSIIGPTQILYVLGYRSWSAISIIRLDSDQHLCLLSAMTQWRKQTNYKAVFGMGLTDFAILSGSDPDAWRAAFASPPKI